jgi:hypothetical protein
MHRAALTLVGGHGYLPRRDATWGKKGKKENQR